MLRNHDDGCTKARRVAVAANAPAVNFVNRHIDITVGTIEEHTGLFIAGRRPEVILLLYGAAIAAISASVCDPPLLTCSRQWKMYWISAQAMYNSIL